MNTLRLVPLCMCALLLVLSCNDQGKPIATTLHSAITTDDELFRYITLTDPFSTYSLFPNADSVTSGTLNGSTAHQPMVRVSMNTLALGALQNDTLPQHSSFPDGSTIFKQIQVGDQTILYAVLYKDKDNPLAANGWLWAEYHPDGSVAYSITHRGAGCTGCHSLERGLMHDFIRTFERQH